MEKTVDYLISDVTLFPDRARLKCSGTLNVEKDDTALLFDELPLSIDPDSLQVAGKGTATVRILGVDIARHHFSQTPSPRARELENEVEKLKDQLMVLDDEFTTWESQLEHLQGLRLATNEYAKGLTRGRRSVEDHKQLMSFLQKQDGQIRLERRRIGTERRELERQVSKLERELNELRSTLAQHRHQCQVSVEVLVPGDFRPELTYIVQKANWRPLYDIRFEENEMGKQLVIGLIAQISQHTGQSWDNVHLAVSTARPALSQRLPEMNPWYVDELVPHPRPSKVRAAAPSLAALSAPAAAEAEPESEPSAMKQADIAQANIREIGAIVNFDLPGSWDIPSDGSPHKMLLARFSPAPKVDYLAIPRHTDAVFRRAKFVNDSNSNLLIGDAAVFVGNEFVGKTRIEHTAIGQEIELLLGVEEEIVVKRELTRRTVDKRLLRENRVLQYAYEIKLQNLMQQEVTVELQDQLPISKHEQIKIKLERAQPEPSQRNDLNYLEWRLQIMPGEEIVVEYAFTVEHPSAMRIRGLNE
ncbi:MAG: mucoidy inhibitor MuiA family protein [Candidatus Promineifilaceae bacterium]|nr:mucoidy inhibitor MuiA family protein [Candidatus Promineifilaceae bacterium]